MLLAVLLTSISAPEEGRLRTAAETRAVEAAVKRKLIDPESARFKHPVVRVPAGSAGKFYCGFVNSKNSFGGYTGDTLFMAGFATEMKNGKITVWADVVDVANADPNSDESRALTKTCSKYPTYSE